MTDAVHLQLLRFGLVGGAATLTYVAVTVSLVELHAASEGWSSAGGMLAGFVVSYIGHHHFTFGKRGGHSSYAPKFLAVQAGLAVCLSLVMELGVNVIGIDYRFMVGFTALSWPIFSFTLSKFWVFASRLSTSEADGTTSSETRIQ